MSYQQDGWSSGRPLTEASQPNGISILRWICSSGGVVQLSELCKQNLFTNLHDAQFFFQRHPQYFRLEGIAGNDCKVYAHTPAEICSRFEHNADYCRVYGCDKFHLCKHFVIGNCRYGIRCSSTHRLDSDHNQLVACSHQLDDLDDEIILKLLKLSCVEYTVPDVCKYYNSITKCDDTERCKFLHICRYYIQGDCKFLEQCRRSHNILDQQPRQVLEEFGIDVEQDPMDLVQMVRYKKRCEGGDAYSDTESDDGYRDTDSDDGGYLYSNSGWKPDHPLICIFHLGGACNYGDQCVNIHTEEPFQWQWQQRTNDEWIDFSPGPNWVIEKAFCDVSKTNTHVNWRGTGKTVIANVDLDEHRMTYDIGTAQFEREVRRLGPRFESQGWRSAFVTTWLWYWKDDDGRYIEYGKQEPAQQVNKTFPGFAGYCAPNMSHAQAQRSLYTGQMHVLKPRLPQAVQRPNNMPQAPQPMHRMAIPGPATAAAAAQSQRAGFKYATVARNTQNFSQPDASGVPQQPAQQVNKTFPGFAGYYAPTMPQTQAQRGLHAGQVQMPKPRWPQAVQRPSIPQAPQVMQRMAMPGPATDAAAAAAAAQNQRSGFKYAAAARNTQNLPQSGTSGVPQQPAQQVYKTNTGLAGYYAPTIPQAQAQRGLYAGQMQVRNPHWPQSGQRPGAKTRIILRKTLLVYSSIIIDIPQAQQPMQHVAMPVPAAAAAAAASVSKSQRAGFKYAAAVRNTQMSQNNRGTEAVINSKSLEEAYRSFLTCDQEGRVYFETRHHRYEIDFQKMKQKNQRIGTEREVRRRPQFASKTDVNERIQRHKDASTALTSVPDIWDKDVISQTEDFQLCSVSKTSEEFRDTARRFLATLPGASIVSIKRVQNVELWEEFNRKRRKMEKKNGGVSISEGMLFHGTTMHALEAICQQNFDHRLSGTRVGAKFGQGTYFHKSAMYSDVYAKSDSRGHKCMFLARVLVGSFTKGSQDLRRPPPKDLRRPLDLYDTCVDDTANPSIFVIFENNQVYPEYIIVYA
ncbi:zinc finger CCCH-type antiviral protein 1-like [Amphiura filiformis]|uniref:zinc finger CCCH-type antiviral protein 1-like n=1 Tax=Amphiura filiformis TaxID=82378 RepID=UPI003B21812A